jgi:hypothetical protein
VLCYIVIAKLSGILDVVEKLLSTHNEEKKTEELKLSCSDALGSLVDEGDPAARGHNAGRVLYHEIGARSAPGSSFSFSRYPTIYLYPYMTMIN